MYNVSQCHSIQDIGCERWNHCARASQSTYNPFVDYHFLAALEQSGSVGGETGWMPMHTTVARDDELVGVCPTYIKYHSQGEYVFDYTWAEAWHRVGGTYYPKIQVSIPFTPVSGPRLLVAHGSDCSQVEEFLLSGIESMTQKLNLSSAHITYLPHSQWKLAQKQGWLPRQQTQFHWYNEDYATFAAFLDDLSSKKRKNIRRERKEVIDQGLCIEWVTGTNLNEHHWDSFYQFYMDTGYRKWGSPYLNRDFFSILSSQLADNILLILAKRNQRYVAGALHLIGSNTLFGRNWGCIEDHSFLHFELCYYQAIEFAIQHKLDTVEAGAQGSHKLSRGYRPVSTYSVHFFENSNFRAAVENFLKDESRYIEYDQKQLAEHLPFRAAELN